MSTKPLVLVVMTSILLPIFSYSQQFTVNDVLRESDEQLFQKELLRVSPMLQKLTAIKELSKGMSYDEAKAIVEEKIKQFQNARAGNAVAQPAADEKSKAQFGLALYIMMSGITDEDKDVDPDPKPKFGGGFGFYVMWQLANFIIMPELLYLNRGFKEQVGNVTTATRFAQLALAVTVLYVIRATGMNFVFGISPMLAYALSGKYIYDDGDKESIEFDDQGVNRTTTSLGITAGVLLKQAIMIRLIYGLGLSKVYDNNDAKMFMWALAINMPFSLFKAK